MLAHVANPTPHPNPGVRPPSHDLALTLASCAFSLCSQNLGHLFSSMRVAGQDSILGQSETEKRAMNGNGSLLVLSRGVILGSVNPCPLKCDSPGRNLLTWWGKGRV